MQKEVDYDYQGRNAGMADRERMGITSGVLGSCCRPKNTVHPTGMVMSRRTGEVGAKRGREWRVRRVKDE